MVARVVVPTSVTPTSLAAWVLNLGRNSARLTDVKLYDFLTVLLPSVLITSVNSLSASGTAPSVARLKSWARRASDSIIRSSTASRAILFATCWVIVGSKLATLSGICTDGILGRIHTREEADCGPRPVLVGSETAPTEIAHTPGSVPEPTVRVTVGSVPSDSSAAGVGLWVAMSDEMGTQPTQIAATKNAAGARQLIWRIALVNRNPSSNGAIKRARPNRPAHAPARRTPRTQACSRARGRAASAPSR